MDYILFMKLFTRFSIKYFHLLEKIYNVYANFLFCNLLLFTAFRNTSESFYLPGGKRT